MNALQKAVILACLAPLVASASIFDLPDPVASFQPLTYSDGSKAWRVAVTWSPKTEKSLGVSFETWLEEYLPRAMANHGWCGAGWVIERQAPAEGIGGVLVEGRCK